MGREEEKFGLFVDCMGAAMKGIVLYVALLITNFWMYQGGGGDFQPWILFSIIFYMMALAFIYNKYDGGLCVLLHLAAGILWGSFGVIFITNKVYYIGAVLLGAGESLVQKFLLGDFDARNYARRYKMQNYLKWGVMIALLSILMVNNIDAPSEEYPISADVCSSYIVVAFGMYLITIAAFRYIFLQYDYFRQRDSMDGYAYKQLKRMNGIMTVVIVLLIGLSILLINKTLVQLFDKLVGALLKLLMGTAIIELSKIETQQTTEHSYVDVPTGEFELPETRNIFHLQIPVEIILAIIAGLVVLWVLKMIYKFFAANYVIGNDEAEFIVAREHDKKEYFAVDKESKMSFDNNNRGKIRRLYYKFMNGRMDKADAVMSKGKTPKELARRYGKAREEERLDKMTMIYEKARYSNEDCTDEDVMNMKSVTGER